MDLLEIYKAKNKDNDWFEKHSSLSKDYAGRMFEYTNTNFRTQKSFASQFKMFLEIENTPREEWSKQKNHGQEIDKHRVINMVQSKLFKKDGDGLYSRTEKGILYNEFIDSEIQPKERWLINYLFLLNGYYLNQKNYIIHRVGEDLLSFFLCVDGINENTLIEYAKELLKADSFEAITRSHFFYLHSFYDDSDFLIKYFRASNKERERLAKYIENNLKTQNFECCISKKYQLKGNFNKEMLFDETKVFLLTLFFVQAKDVNSGTIYEFFVKEYKKNISSIDKDLVLNYLHINNNIFGPIFNEILETEDIGVDKEDIEMPQPSREGFKDAPETYIDETSEVGKLKIKTIYSLRKKQARAQNNYQCGLEKINNCSSTYFTAKASGKNYLELHHFIPREFRNDFSYSIEVLANYITLCPRCHRQIHFAVDRERKNLINALFEDRKNRLKTVGLDVKLGNIYDYYKIDS